MSVLALYVAQGYWEVGYAEGDDWLYPISELQGIAPSAIIELFELQLNTAIQGINTIYRFHAGTNATGANGNLVWAGNTYQAFPIEAEGFEYSGNGQLPRPKIRVSNILGTITAIILATPLEGAKVTRIRTMARYLDAVNFAGGVNPLGTPDPTCEWPREIYILDRKTVETRDVVEYEMCAAFDMIGIRGPKRQCIANICQWVYRSAECGYTEASYYDENDNPVNTALLDVCGKKLSSCQTRFGAISKTGSTIKNSTTLTVSSTAGLSAGLPIYGFGVPTNATINSITNNTSLVMSAAATVSTNFTLTATPSASDASMAVASSTNVAAGQAVSGPYIPSGTTVASVSGTTVTLNQRPYSIKRSGTYTINYVMYGGSTVYIAIDTTGISAGMYVWGSCDINTTVSSIGSGLIYLNSYGTLDLDLIDGVSVDLYFMPASPGSATYTFNGNNLFIFRTQSGNLPFGSFPGVGTNVY